DSPDVLRSADGIDRHRLEHDLGDDENGRIAEGIADVSHPVTNAAGGTNGNQPAPARTSKNASGIRRALAPTARRVAADERGTGRKGKPARQTKPRSRTQEPGNRTSEPRPARKGRATHGDIQI